MNVVQFPDRSAQLAQAAQEEEAARVAQEAAHDEALAEFDRLVAERADSLAAIQARVAAVTASVEGMTPKQREKFLLRARVDGVDQAVEGPHLRSVSDGTD